MIICHDGDNYAYTTPNSLTLPTLENSKLTGMTNPGELSEEEMFPDLSMKKLLLSKSQLSYYNIDNYLKDDYIEI